MMMRLSDSVCITLGKISCSCELLRVWGAAASETRKSRKLCMLEQQNYKSQVVMRITTVLSEHNSLTEKDILLNISGIWKVSFSS